MHTTEDRRAVAARAIMDSTGMDRSEAEAIAGSVVDALAVADNLADVTMLSGMEKSTFQKVAEEMIAKGARRIGAGDVVWTWSGACFRIEEGFAAFDGVSRIVCTGRMTAVDDLVVDRRGAASALRDLLAHQQAADEDRGESEVAYLLSLALALAEGTPLTQEHASTVDFIRKTGEAARRACKASRPPREDELPYPVRCLLEAHGGDVPHDFGDDLAGVGAAS
jgi:hypothetical protein